MFAGETRPSEWPEPHRKTLQAIHELGNRKYDTYADSSEQANQEPWRAERKSLAEVLTQVAKRFHHRNESSWRHGCEPIILGRLSSEVCWQVNPPWKHAVVFLLIPDLAGHAASGYGGLILKSAGMAALAPPLTCGTVNKRGNPAVARDKAAPRTSRHSP